MVLQAKRPTKIEKPLVLQAKRPNKIEKPLVLQAKRPKKNEKTIGFIDPATASNQPPATSHGSGVRVALTRLDEL